MKHYLEPFQMKLVRLVLWWLLWLWFEKNNFIKSAFSWGWFEKNIYLAKTMIEIKVE